MLDLTWIEMVLEMPSEDAEFLIMEQCFLDNLGTFCVRSETETGISHCSIEKCTPFIGQISRICRRVFGINHGEMLF